VPSSAQSRPEHSRYLIFGASSVALLMSSVDATIVATALPSMTRELHTSIAWSSWTITAYLLGQTIAMPLTGRLSDGWGRRRMFLAYIALFTLASLCSGLAPNVYLLILFRFLQALGGGGFMPSASGVVSDTFGRDRDRAIGLFSSVFPLGAMVGPALGGFIVTYWSWREIFFINVPVGLLLIVLLWRVLPSSRPATAQRFDAVGSLLSSAMLFATMLALNQLGERGLGSPLPWFILALAVVLGVAFVGWQKRSTSPIVPTSLLLDRVFVVVNALNLLYGASALGVFSLVPLFAQATHGVDPLRAGLLLTVRALGMMVVALPASMCLRRTGYRLPMVAGFALVAAGLAMLAVTPAGANAFVWLAAASLLSGCGVGLAGPASNNAVIELMPDQIAVITGLRGMFRQAGAIVSISISALVITSSGGRDAILGAVFVVMAALMVLGIPSIAVVPERARVWGRSGGASEPPPQPMADASGE
jgi:EmrB/QacA subfamily drug resistance transporter